MRKLVPVQVPVITESVIFSSKHRAKGTALFSKQTLNYKYLVRYFVNKQNKKKTCVTDMFGYGKEIGDHFRNTIIFF